MNANSINTHEIEGIDFWKSLSPSYHITDQPFSAVDSPYQLPQEIQKRVREQMIHDGYFQTPPVIDPHTIMRLRELVEQLDQRGIMPIFAALYDEFWINIHRLRVLLDPILGGGYRCIPDFWVWLVPTDESKTGWAPHRDGEFTNSSIRDDGTPTLCTAWNPLTDVTPDNACIYVLPRRYDLFFQNFVRNRAGQAEIPNVGNIPMDLASIRALPAKAG